MPFWWVEEPSPNLIALAKQEEIRTRQHSLEQEKRGLEAILYEAQNTEARLRAFNEFCSTVSHRLDDLTFDEKRKILRLLNIQGRVSKGQIYLSGCIPSWEKQEEMFAYQTFESGQLSQLHRP